MGDTLSTLRTRFLEEIDDPGQTVATSTNARITRLLNEGQRHAGHVIQKRDPHWPLKETQIGKKDVARTPLPDDFAEDYAVYRDDLTGKPTIRKVSVREWNDYRFNRPYLFGDVNDVGGEGIVPDVLPHSYEVYYIERPWIGILPIPTDETSRYVLKYRAALLDLSDDNDRTDIPVGNGTDVICLYAAVSFLSRRGHDAVAGLMARLQAAEARLAADFGGSAGSIVEMQVAQDW